MSNGFDPIKFGQNLAAILEKYNLPLDIYELYMMLADLDPDEISITWQHHRKEIYEPRRPRQSLDFDELAKDLLSLIHKQGLRLKRMGLTVLMPDAEFSELAKKYPDYHKGESIEIMTEENNLLWFIQILRRRKLPVSPD